MGLPSGPLSRLKHGSSGTAATAAYSSSDEPMTHRNGAAVEIDMATDQVETKLICKLWKPSIWTAGSASDGFR